VKRRANPHFRAPLEDGFGGFDDCMMDLVFPARLVCHMTPVTSTHTTRNSGAPDYALARLAAQIGQSVGMPSRISRIFESRSTSSAFTITGGRPECRLNLVFTLHESAIEIRGQLCGRRIVRAVELARTIVAAVVDEYQLEP